MTTTPDPDVARVLGLVLANLAHPERYITVSWAVNVHDIPVRTTSPAAVRWSLHGLVRRHALPDEALEARVWAALCAHFPQRANFLEDATEKERVQVTQAALAVVRP